MESVYTDSQGTFGFHNLGPNPYTISIDDDQYQPVQEPAVIEANSLTPVVFLNITLVPKKQAKASVQELKRPAGANPSLADVREYSARFAGNDVVKQFEKGVRADEAGRREEAVRYYKKALKTAPEFYPAHNNLGSDYLSKSDLPAARREFETVIRLNQSDAAAYFNLSNVCMLMGELVDAHLYLAEGMRREPESALGQFLMGSLAMREANYEQAETALRQAIHLNPGMAQAHLQLINLFLERGRRSDAVNELRAFLSAFPDTPFTPKARQLLQKLEKAGS